MEEENQEAKKVEQAVKNTAKNTAKNAAKTAGNLLKKAIKKLIALIGIKVFIIVIIVVLGITTISAFWWGITKETYDSIGKIATESTDDSSGNINKITKIENNQIVIDDEEFKTKITTWFENNHVSTSALGLNEDLTTLRKFLEAEIVTQFPDLRKRAEIGTPVPESQLQGVVQFKRDYENGTSELLEYMKYEDFRKEVAKFGVKIDEEEKQEKVYFTKADVENAYNELRRYFTIDEEKNLLIVSLSSTEKIVEYSDYAIEEGKDGPSEYEYYFDLILKKVNYQSMISQYTMPFEFNFALLLISQNYGFCEEVANLAKNSKIVIDIQDNLTNIQDVYIYGYKSNFIAEKYVTYYERVTDYGKDQQGNRVIIGSHLEGPTNLDPYPVSNEIHVVASKYRIQTDITKNTNVALCVSEALTWIADYTSEYSNIQKEPNIQTIVSKDEDDTEYKEVEDYHNYLKMVTYTLPLNAERVSEKRVLKEKQYDKTTNIETTINENTYTKNLSKVEPKYEKFLSLLKIDSNLGIFNLDNILLNDKLIGYKNQNSDRLSSPEDNILSAQQALYELLASNSKTASFEEIMRILIDIYTGKIKASEVQFDFSIFEPGEFLNFSTGGTSNIDGVPGQIYDFLLSKGMSSVGVAAILGNIEQESSFRTSASNGTHFGLCQWDKNNRFAKLQNYAGTRPWTDINVQLEYMWIELEGGYSNVKNALMNATDLYAATDYFCRHFEICGNYAVEVPRRYNFAKKWYEKWEENHTEIGIEESNSIITWAIAQVGKTAYYSNYTKQYERSRVGDTGYCAKFVKNAYFEAGFQYMQGNAINLPHPNQMQYTSDGKVNCDTIPIGAYVVSSGTSQYGHVALYIGNGYVVEAGGNTIVKNEINKSYGANKFLGWGYPQK